jgi:hypothetical protein
MESHAGTVAFDELGARRAREHVAAEVEHLEVVRAFSQRLRAGLSHPAVSEPEEAESSSFRERASPSRADPIAA